MRVEKVLLGLIGIIFFTSFIIAIPQITVHSPQAVEYGSTKILLNASSNEVVDFFIKDPRGRRDTILVGNTTNLVDYLYVNEGGHSFTVWANNSNGETNATVNFNSTVHNPVNITSCGILASSDTEYVLQNDILSSQFFCLSMNNLRNVTLDLNEHRISGKATILAISESSDITVINGFMNSSKPISSFSELMVFSNSVKIKIENVNLSGFVGMDFFSLRHSIFKNMNINSSVGVWYEDVSDVYFINSVFNWNGFNSSFTPKTSAFNSFFGDSEFFLENVTIDESFPDSVFYVDGTFTDFYLRSTHVDMSKIRYPLGIADTRIFTQHLVIVNVTDQLGLTGASSVSVKDNGVLPRKTGFEARFNTLVNPTADLLIPTGEIGTGQEWITEKLTYAKSSSPVVVEEYDFSNYTLEARGWGNNFSTNATLSLSGLNSTVKVDFVINTALGGEELPKCTIQQMLDINNDGSVDTKDALIAIREKVGHAVSEQNTSKGCEALNLNPF